MLTILPLLPNYEYGVTRILSCLTNQLYLCRVSLFADVNFTKSVSADEPIILFAAERILTYYLTKRHTSDKSEESTSRIDVIGDFTGDMMPWTEPVLMSSKQEEEKKSFYWVIPSLFCEISFLSHYCHTIESESMKLKKNLATLKFRIFQFIDSLFKMDLEYACDTILNAWDFWYENKFYTDFLEIKPNFCKNLYAVLSANKIEILSIMITKRITNLHVSGAVWYFMNLISVVM